MTNKEERQDMMEKRNFVTSSRTPMEGASDVDDIIDAMLDIEDGKVLDSRFNPLKSIENEYRKRLESNFSANGAFTFAFTDDLKLRISGGYLEYTMKNEEFNGSATTIGNP